MEVEPATYEGIIDMESGMNTVKLKGKLSVLRHQIKIQLDTGIQMYFDFDENHKFHLRTFNGTPCIVWEYENYYNGIINMKSFRDLYNFHKELCP